MELPSHSSHFGFLLYYQVYYSVHYLQIESFHPRRVFPFVLCYSLPWLPNQYQYIYKFIGKPYTYLCVYKLYNFSYLLLLIYIYKCNLYVIYNIM